MPVYRVEHAKSNRAGCTGPICKAKATKIGKGDIRIGTWVEIAGNGSFKWRHFGCMTDKVLENMKGEFKNIDNELDGFDEMEKDAQDKLRDAIENGRLKEEDKTPDDRPRKLTKKELAEQQAKEDGDVKSNGSDAEALPAASPASTKKATPKKTPVKRKAMKKEDSDEEEEAVLSDASSAPAPKTKKAKAAPATKASKADKTKTAPRKSKQNKKVESDEEEEAELSDSPSEPDLESEPSEDESLSDVKDEGEDEDEDEGEEEEDKKPKGRATKRAPPKKASVQRKSASKGSKKRK